MSAVKPMTVYYMGPSPNPWKVVIVLEELGLPYELKKLDSSELKVEPYISINPNGRVPALIDPNENITLWEVRTFHIVRYAFVDFTDAFLSSPARSLIILSMSTIRTRRFITPRPQKNILLEAGSISK